jgi:pimeloyl-ACP methyl ester carboxylesterase
MRAALSLSLLLLLSTACTTQPPKAEQPIEAPAAVTSGAKGISDALDGVPYRIDIPATWNGQLVMLLHGYEPAGSPRPPQWPQNELAGLFLARGYAVAASAYSGQGWAVEEGLRDNEALRQHFLRTYGKPRHTFLAGLSLGGFIALASLEAHPAEYDGALSLCGINAPTPTVFSDGVMTALVAIEYFFPGALPLPPGGLTDLAAPATIDPAAVEAILATDETLAGQLATRLQTPRADLAGVVMLDYMILREMQLRAGGQPVDNRDTVYTGFGDDAGFNRGVHRYAGAPAAMAYLQTHGTLTGRISDPVVILSNAMDQTIPARFNESYPELTRLAGTAQWLNVMRPAGEGHCNFANTEVDVAIQTLAQEAAKVAGEQ